MFTCLDTSTLCVLKFSSSLFPQHRPLLATLSTPPRWVGEGVREQEDVDTRVLRGGKRKGKREQHIHTPVIALPFLPASPVYPVPLTPLSPLIPYLAPATLHRLPQLAYSNRTTGMLPYKHFLSWTSKTTINYTRPLLLTRISQSSQRRVLRGVYGLVKNPKQQDHHSDLRGMRIQALLFPSFTSPLFLFRVGVHWFRDGLQQQ